MSMRRISIGAALGWVVAFALGLAALVNATDFWAGATLLLTLATLLGSVLGVILRGWRSGGWLGFAVFGWGYFLFQIFSFWVGLGADMWSISEPVSAWVFEKANPLPALPASMIPPAASPDAVVPGRAGVCGATAPDVTPGPDPATARFGSVALARGQRAAPFARPGRRHPGWPPLVLARSE
jgi:hypothetical protein